MKKYITPELEVLKLNMQDIVTVSGEPEQAALDIGGAASVTGYSANDLKWANDSSAY